MEIRLPATVESVTVIESDSTGRTVPITRYRKGTKKKRKSTVGVREMETFIRRMGEAQQAFIDKYLEKHNSSHRKKRDGWLTDAPSNVFRATEKGMRKMFDLDDDDDDDDDE